jgi:hypothetical protein
LSFCSSIQLTTRERTVANKLIKDYSRTSSEVSRQGVLDIYEKHIETAVKKRDASFSDKRDYKQELYLALLTKLEDMKRSMPNPSFLLSKYLETIKPPKSLFDDMARLDKMDENTITMLSLKNKYSYTE